MNRVALALLVVLTGACFSERSTAPEDTTPCDGATTPCAVNVIDNQFTPATRHVVAGSTVRWTNNGASPHTVTGDDFDSGTLAVGASYERAFPTAGEFDYICQFHEGMTGTIVVE